jgi:hypothetical protein
MFPLYHKIERMKKLEKEMT